MINKHTENPKLKELLQKRQERREQLAMEGASQEQIYAVTIDDVSEDAVPAETGARKDE